MEVEKAAAGKLGVRMYLSRGSMDLSEKDRGLPPDSVVQDIDAIMRDSEDLMKQSAVLARELGVRLHMHLA